MPVSVSPTFQNPPPKDSSYVPNWYDLLVSKKRNIVPTTLSIEYMVSKFLGKTPKDKKPKIKNIFNIDEKIGHWVENILRLTTKKSLDDMLPQDYIMEKTILGLASRATEMKIWTAGNSRIS